jgi:hypothetical protein
VVAKKGLNKEARSKYVVKPRAKITALGSLMEQEALISKELTHCATSGTPLNFCFSNVFPIYKDARSNIEHSVFKVLLPSEEPNARRKRQPGYFLCIRRL